MKVALRLVLFFLSVVAAPLLAAPYVPQARQVIDNVYVITGPT